MYVCMICMSVCMSVRMIMYVCMTCMSVCMSVRMIFVCMYVCLFVCHLPLIHVRLYACTCVCMPVQHGMFFDVMPSHAELTGQNMHACRYGWMDGWMIFECVRLHMHVCISVYMHVCFLHVFMCVQLCVYRHMNCWVLLVV